MKMRWALHRLMGGALALALLGASPVLAEDEAASAATSEEAGVEGEAANGAGAQTPAAPAKPDAKAPASTAKGDSTSTSPAQSASDTPKADAKSTAKSGEAAQSKASESDDGAERPIKGIYPHFRNRIFDSAFQN